MDGFVRSQQVRSLLGALGIAAVVASEPIRIWRLSGVERLHVREGSSVVFKYAVVPFTGEHRVLADLAAQGVPVADLRVATARDGILGMILHDLGQPVREPTEQDAALAAVRLHAADAPAWLEHLGESELAALPGRALGCRDQLTAAGRYGGTSDLREHLLILTQAARARAAGPEWPPFGLCHGELHPSTVHIGVAGWHLLDFAMTLHGPGLLNLAAWSGLRLPPNPPHTRSLIEHYVHAGGHLEALADRGGYPPSTGRWAGTASRPHWLLNCAITAIDPPDTDARHITVLRRQLTSVHDLLVPG